MSLRGFKRDYVATEAAHFADKRSFMSLPKVIVGECTEPKPHLVLYGADKCPIRAEIFRRNREQYHLAGMDINRCYKCGRRVFEGDGWVGRRGHWHHLRNKPGNRCDCPENGAVSCEACHLAEHPQPRFGQKEFA